MKSLLAFVRAVADPTRCRIVKLVSTEALCVCELADILEMPQSSVSSHVQIIRRAGLLEGEKCGKWTYFRIAKKHLPPLAALDAAFPAESGSPMKKDAVRAAKRLRVRAESCCPGPKKLCAPRAKKTSGGVE